MERRPNESWTDYARRRAAAKGLSLTEATKEEPVYPDGFDQDLIPDVPPENSRFAREREEIDAVLGRLSIVDAYNKYCAKMHCDPGGKTESIMVSCPFPWHADKNPSAALNTLKGDGGVGDCYKCQQGFDKYDLAALHFGYDLDEYKQGANFPELRRKMAEGLGYTVMVAGKDQWLERIQPEQPTPPPPPTPAPIETEPPDPIDLDEHRELAYPDPLDWRTLPFISPDTFMWEWMTETSRGHQPEEFYLFEGLVALGLAVGNNVLLDDETPVRPNLMVCLVGGTGSGKSRSVQQFNNLLNSAIPFNKTTGGGVKRMHSPGSGEDLINQMIHYTTDPTTKEQTFFPVRGLLYEDEFEGLMAKVNRAGSSYRPSLMKFFDSKEPVSKSSQTTGAAIATDHFLEVLTTTQPKRLSALMTAGDATSGFLNRWLFVFGTEKYRPSISTVRFDLKSAAVQLQLLRSWSSQGIEVHLDFDPNVVDRWDHFVQTQVRPVEATDNVLVSRIELQCKKLLLLMAINDRSTTVMEKHLTSLLLMFPYMKKCYGVVDEKVGKTEVEECIGAMMKYFSEHPDDEVSMRTLAKSSGARNYDSFTRVRAIELLLKMGDINEVPSKRAAKVIRWQWVPNNPQPALATVHPLFP
jgi:energy-coupling factor transporter ATP-binding protein EcfA2